MKFDFLKVVNEGSRIIDIVTMWFSFSNNFHQWQSSMVQFLIKAFHSSTHSQAITPEYNFQRSIV